MGGGVPGATLLTFVPTETIRSSDTNTNNKALNYDQVYDVRRNGAQVDGATDDSSAINAAITAAGNNGGGIVMIPGICAVNSQILLNQANVLLVGIGAGSGIRPLSTFSGSQIIYITSDFCGVKDMTIAYTNTSTSSNPVADGIRITGARSIVLSNVYLNYINGWGVHSTATASIANYWCVFSNVHTYQCSTGFRIAGNSGSGYNMAHSLIGCIADQCNGGDGYLIDAAHDIVCCNLEGSVTGGSGATFHVRDASAAVYVSNVDLGPAPGPSIGPTVLIEAYSGNNPKQITFNAGILEGGEAGAVVSAGSQIRFVDLDIINNGTYGLNITGGDAIIVEGCLFNLNGSNGSTGRYDFQSSTTGHVEVNDCYFLTPQGTSSQETNNAVNVTAGNVVFQNDTFSGTGYNATNIFNGFPSVVRNCPGYNPVGGVTVAVPASGVAAGYKASQSTVYITGGTVTGIAINGTTTGLTSGTFHVPPQGYVILTYSVAPTWQWILD